MMTLMKHLGGKWENVRANLTQDLDHIQEWANTLEESLLGNGQNQTIQASTILGSPTPVPKYVASTGTGNNPQWDQVDLASSGVKNRLKYGNLTAASGPSLLLGTGSGSPGSEDWEEINLDPDTMEMDGTTLKAIGDGISNAQLAARISLRV